MDYTQINTRIINKHATEAEWNEATNFVPLKGELIIYDPDEDHDYFRCKIGTGDKNKNVNELPFMYNIEAWEFTYDDGSKETKMVLLK